MAPDSSETQVVAEVDWQFAECARACSEILKHRLVSPFWRVFRLAVTLLIVALLLLMTVAALMSDVGTATYLWTIAPWILILLLLLGLRLGGAGWLGAWQIRRNNPNMVAGMRHSISLAAYTVWCGQIQSTAQWPGILKVVETRRFFLSFPIKSGAYYLPKRVLSDEQCATIRSIMIQQAAERFVQRAA